MNTNVIQFPADRCHRPATVIETAERAAYEQPAERFATTRGHLASIETMMRLALEGACSVGGPRAAAWLFAQCGVLVR